jgi:two-component system NtrC family response regulator
MTGTSPEMQTVFASVRKVATTDAPVLILGESGTGKERVALAIHRRSRRKDGPFVPINCGAIPANLLESELFGHEKGTFTGAHAQRIGRIETAVGGTLFLDEIGELPLALQVKLLRFLQEQQIERVGGRKPIDVDTRVIAATNLDLTKAVKEGTFREDFYYRVAVVTIKLPALRSRQGDVAVLAHYFLERFASEAKKEKLKFDSGALRAIEQYGWPGNVRELENRVRRAVIMTEGPRVGADDLELAGSDDIVTPRTLREVRESAEREVIQQALRRQGGKISRAAEELGISRPTLYELIEKLGLGKPAEDKE